MAPDSLRSTPPRRPGRTGPSLPILLAFLVVGVAQGCGSVSITRVDRKVSGGRPAAFATAQGWPAPAPSAIDGAASRDVAALIEHAEANRRAASGASEASKAIAARYDLEAIADAADALRVAEAGGERAVPKKEDSPEVSAARGAYRSAVADFLRDSSGRKVRVDDRWAEKLAEGGAAVSIDRERSTWEPDRFDELQFADDYKVDGLPHMYRTDGLGVPMIGIRWFRPTELSNRDGEERFLLPREVYPVTAVVRPVTPPAPEVGAYRAPAREFRVELHDPQVVREVEFDGRKEPLTADLSTSLAYHFVHSPLPILQEIGLLDPQWLEKLAGLYMLHPYQEGKIPIVLVHGLRSSPAAWLKVMNEVRGNPRFRERYQIWLFMYPTGTPFPYSAAKLRKQLNQLREVVDPDRKDKALDNAVVIGHSMGGLITRLLVSSSGETMWRLMSDRPFEELKASPERKEMLRDVFFFEPHPSVTRAVFIATPHGGSELGDEFIGRLADRLIRLPSSLRRTYRSLIALNGADFFSREARSGGMPSSIDELRRNNRLLTAMMTLPVRDGLVAHSVIGRKDPADPIPESTDGVVPYGSSHIDWATSELVVPGDHGCQDTPATIEELERILTLHLDGLQGKLPTPPKFERKPNRPNPDRDSPPSGKPWGQPGEGGLPEALPDPMGVGSAAKAGAKAVGSRLSGWLPRR